MDVVNLELKKYNFTGSHDILKINEDYDPKSLLLKIRKISRSKYELTNSWRVTNTNNSGYANVILSWTAKFSAEYTGLP